MGNKKTVQIWYSINRYYQNYRKCDRSKDTIQTLTNIPGLSFVVMENIDTTHILQILNMYIKFHI